MSGMDRLDRKLHWCVPLSVKILSPVLLGALLLSGGSCNKDKKKGTTPAASSSGSVSDGVPMDPSQDPANIDPDGDVPTADPNDRPPERGGEGGSGVGGVDATEGQPELRPPGLDMSPAEQAAKLATHLKAAQAAMQSAVPERAIAEAKDALQVDESSIEAMVLLAHGNVVRGYYDLAEDVLLKCFARGGKSNKQAFFLLGLVYENTKRPEKAPVAYQNALTLDPDYKSALMNLGVSHLRTRRFQDAVQIYERLTSSLNMDNAAVWTNLGSAYRGHSVDFQLTDITMRNTLVLKAEQAFKRAISKDKNYPNAYYNLGLLYLDADPYPTSDGELDKITRLKNAKTYFDEYRRLPGADLKLVDETSAVAQKLLDREELLRAKQAEREAKLRAAAEKKAKRDAEKPKKDPLDSDEGFE